MFYWCCIVYNCGFALFRPDDAFVLLPCPHYDLGGCFVRKMNLHCCLVRAMAMLSCAVYDYKCCTVILFGRWICTVFLSERSHCTVILLCPDYDFSISVLSRLWRLHCCLVRKMTCSITLSELWPRIVVRHTTLHSCLVLSGLWLCAVSSNHFATNWFLTFVLATRI